nr:hypothetical protein CFP56_64177 [Quercus suber]
MAAFYSLDSEAVVDDIRSSTCKAMFLLQPSYLKLREFGATDKLNRSLGLLQGIVNKNARQLYVLRLCQLHPVASFQFRVPPTRSRTCPLVSWIRSHKKRKTYDGTVDQQAAHDAHDHGLDSDQITMSQDDGKR